VASTKTLGEDSRAESSIGKALRMSAKPRTHCIQSRIRKCQKGARKKGGGMRRRPLFRIKRSSQYSQRPGQREEEIF